MLEPYYKTLEEEKAERDATFSRALELRAKIKQYGKGIEGTYLFSGCDSLGDVTVYVYPSEKTEKIKHNIVKFLLDLAPNKKPERFFNKEKGTFSWRISWTDEDSSGKYRAWIWVDDVFEGACSIKKVTKTVTVFEADCSKKANA